MEPPAAHHPLIDALKAELKAAGLTYAALARELGMAESSVKRMFAKGDMPLARIDAICRVLRTDFAELARRMAEAQPLKRELTLEQERAVVADRKLLLTAICCLSQWTLEQIVATYRLTEAEAIRHLAWLDRLGLIELRPLNRYRLRMAKTFRWRPHGPVMRYFREHLTPLTLPCAAAGGWRRRTAPAPRSGEAAPAAAAHAALTGPTRGGGARDDTAGSLRSGRPRRAARRLRSAQSVRTSMRRGRACACLGRCSLSTPSFRLASMCSVSSSRLSVKLRR